MREFTNHDEVMCPWYPDQLCPGECQYILEHDECIQELAPRRPRAGREGLPKRREAAASKPGA